MRHSKMLSKSSLRCMARRLRHSMLIEIFLFCSSLPKSLTVFPSSTRPIRDVIPDRYAIDSTVVSGKSGVEAGTEKAWELCEKYKLPRMIYVTGTHFQKMFLHQNSGP